MLRTEYICTGTRGAVVTQMILQLLLRTAAAAACTGDDWQCELNGQCVVGVCRCDAQWYGPTCGQLRLEPTTRDSGYRGGGSGALARVGTADPTSTWGGSIIGPDGTGQWHMIVARMSLSCGLTSWKTNSEVVQAVASNPLGPYTPREPPLIRRFSHNPTVHKSASGAYYLYHIGCGDNSTTPLTSCTNGSTPEPPPDHYTDGSSSTRSVTAAGGCNGPHWMGGMTAHSLDGPWLPFPSEITLSSPSKTDHWLTNPAPTAMSNGSLLWLYRQNAGSWPRQNATSERLGVATAVSWDAMTLEDRTPKTPIFPFALEDQYVWQDRRGNFHALTHKGMPRRERRQQQQDNAHRVQEDQQVPLGSGSGSGSSSDLDLGSKGGGTPMAGHLFSRDGLSWGIGVEGAPYNTTLSFTDGTSMQTGKRARPQLVVKDGVPLYLTTGASLPGHGDFIFTTVQPIAQG